MRRPKWNCGAALVLLAAAWWPSVAGADDTADIEWTAPSGCPERSEFVSQLDEFLGIPVDSLDSVHIEVRVERTGEGWTLAMGLRVREHEGERSFDGADCAELVSSAAISAALSLDPSVLEQEPERRSGIDPVWDGERPPGIEWNTPGPEAPVVRTRTPGPKVDASARVLLGVDANGMPRTSAAAGIMLGLQMRVPWVGLVRVEAGGMYWRPQVRNDENDSGIKVSRVVGRVAACYQYWWAQLCGIAEFGQIESESFGYNDIFGMSVDAQLKQEFDWGGGGALGIVIPMRKSFGFRLDTEVVGGGVRPRLTVPPEVPMGESRELYQRDLFVFRAFAGLEVVIR